MHTQAKITLIVGLALAATTAAFAQSLEELQALSPEDRRAYIQAMSTDERSAMREKWRSEFDTLPAEEQQAIREQRRAERRERFESMSDEQRAAVRASRDERIAARAERRQGRGRAEGNAAQEDRQ